MELVHTCLTLLALPRSWRIGDWRKILAPVKKKVEKHFDESVYLLFAWLCFFSFNCKVLKFSAASSSSSSSSLFSSFFSPFSFHLLFLLLSSSFSHHLPLSSILSFFLFFFPPLISLLLSTPILRSFQNTRVNSFCIKMTKLC